MKVNIMSLRLSAILLLVFICFDANAQAVFPSAEAPYEPYLREVTELSLEELLELHQLGRMDATILLARSLWWNGDVETPIQLLQEPAAQGIPVAQYLLGFYLRFKNRDPEGSVRWLTAAATAGHPIAQETLAGYYEDGSFGFQKDVRHAFQLYREAAEQGLKHSQMLVGVMLCSGKGTPQDKVEGSKWFLKSQEGQKVPFSLKDAGCN
jgi:TPR repeat protein